MEMTGLIVGLGALLFFEIQINAPGTLLEFKLMERNAVTLQTISVNEYTII
jgi:hypothetical protein